MTEETNKSSSSLPREQALKWVVRLQSGESTEEDRQNLEHWLRESPSHRQEFEHFTKVWSTLDATPPQLTVELSQAEDYWEQHAPIPSSSWLGSFLHWGQTGAAIGAMAAMIMCILWWWPETPGPTQYYQTAKGEQQSITLVDGSTIIMNTDSKLSVQMSDHERIVILQQGEAVFTVAHEKERSFDVHADNGIIHDIGTQFLVQTFPRKVRVAVLEGMVEVGLNSGKIDEIVPRSKVLRKGEQVFYTAEAHISAIKEFAAQSAMAWIDGKLVFVEKPLADVLKEWARYRSGEIRLRDENLGAIPISGVFRIDNVESFFQALQSALPIRLTHVSPQLVLLERKS